MPDDFSADPATTGILLPGTAVQGNIEAASDHDWFAMELEAGMLYRLSVSGLRSGGGTQPHPILSLRDAAGVFLQEARQDTEFPDADPQAYFRPDTSGTWYLDVGSYDPAAQAAPPGSYTALLTALPGVVDEGQSVATAVPMELGTPVTGLIETAGDRDWFAVELLTGMSYIVDLEGASTDKGTLPDPSVMVWMSDTTRLPGQIYFDDTDEAVLPNNDAGEGFNSRLEFTVPRDGTYYLEASRYSNGFDDYDLRTGTYTLTIAGVPLPTLSGTDGNDWLLMPMGAGIRRVAGGAGQDMLSFAGFTTGISVDLDSGGAYADSKRIVLDSIEGVTGTSHSDWVYGSDGDDWFRGLGGRDIFFGSAGADTYDGGTGTDLVSYYEYSTPDFDAVGVNASLLRGKGWSGEAAGDRYDNIEDLGGTIYGDNILTGDHGNNALYGWYGDDTLMGNGGDDIIHAGFGTDVIIFGYDRDQYEVTQSGIKTVVEYIGIGPGDGTDTLLSAEILRFADGDMIL